MKKNKMKVGIVGLGKRGATHFRNYKKIEGIRVVALCDYDIKLADKNNYAGIAEFCDYKEMVRAVKMDIVSICTPSCFHFEIAKFCIEAGVNIIIEKPMTLDYISALKLFSLAKKKSISIIVGYNYLFSREIIKIRQILDSGELGKILTVRGRQSHNWGGGRPFGWLMDEKKSGGGTLIDNTSHYLSLFDFLLGNIEKIHAFSNSLSFGSLVEDNVVVTFKTKNGVLGTIESSWKDASGRNNQLIIYGEKAVLEFSENNEKKIFEIRKYETDADEWNRFIRQSLYIPSGIEQIKKKRNIDNSMCLYAENTENLLRYFIDEVKNKKLSMTYLKNSIKTQKLIECAYKSIKNGRAISIK